MILSFYLPAMVVIVLTALATCVSGGKEPERRGREKGNACVFHAFSFFLDASSASSFLSQPRHQQHLRKKKKKKKNSHRAYAAPRVPLHARAIVLVAWITSASIVALVPLDVWTTLTAAHKSGGAGGEGGEGGGGGGGHRRRRGLFSASSLSSSLSSSSSSSSSSASLEALWAAAYWTTQALTWCVIPLAQCASDAGDATPLKRLRTAAADCARFYLLVGSAVGAGVVALLAGGRLRWRDLPSLAVVLVNAYGLVAIVLLLGAGLVGIPKQLWRRADARGNAARAYLRVGAAAARLSSAAEEARAVATVLAATSAAMPRRDPLREQVDRLCELAEETAPFSPSRDAARDASGRIALDNLTDADLDAGSDERSLAELGRRLIRSTGTYNGVAAQYAAAVRAAAQAEAVARARAAGEPSLLLSSGGGLGGGGGGGGGGGASSLGRAFGEVASSSSSSSLASSSSPLSSLLLSRLPPAASSALLAARAWFEVQASPWANRLAAALLLAPLSASLVWSEATLGTGASPDLSPFSRAVRRMAAAGTGSEGSSSSSSSSSSASASPLGAQLLVAVPLGYMALAVYRSLFGLGVFPFYRVVAGATEARSLLANAGQVSRFAAPLAYNYLHVLKLQGGGSGSGGGGSSSSSSSSPSTVFAKKMAASLRDVPVFGKSFNNWFPAVVAVHVALLLVDAWGRAARALPLPAKVKLLLAAAAADAGDGDGDGADADGGGERQGNGNYSSSPSTSLAERGRALVRAELAAAQAGRPLGAGLAAEASAEGVGGVSSTMLPPPSPTGAGGMGSAGRGGGGLYNSSSSPARSTETELLSRPPPEASGRMGGIGGRLASAWGRVQRATVAGLGASAPPGGLQRGQNNPPAASSMTAGGVTVGTARRLAGISPLTRSLLSGGRGGGGGGGGGGGAMPPAPAGEFGGERAALLGGGGATATAAAPYSSGAAAPFSVPAPAAPFGGGGGAGGLDDLFSRLESGGGGTGSGGRRNDGDDEDDLI